MRYFDQNNSSAQVFTTETKNIRGGSGMLIVYESMDDVVSDNETRDWDHSFNKYQADYWTYGSDYRNQVQTREALMSGRCADRLRDMVEKAQQDILQKYPEIKELERNAFQKRRRRIFKDEGDELDIDRYMSGETECWQKKAIVREKRALKIFIHLGQLANEHADNITKTIINMAAISDLIEKAGISTEIYVGAYSTLAMSREICQVMTATKCKEAHQPLDISRLMSFGAPGYFRYYTFGMRTNLIPGVKGTSNVGATAYSFDEVGQEMKDHMNLDIVCMGESIDAKMSMVMNDVRKFLE